MEIKFNLAEDTTEFLQQIVKLEASLRGAMNEEEINDFLMDMLKKGMDVIYDRQIEDFHESLELKPDQVFENLTVGPNGGIVWLNDFGTLLEFTVC